MKERLFAMAMAGMLLFSVVSVHWSPGPVGETPPVLMSDDCQGGGQC